MNEWKKLDITNLPNDIMVGNYDVEICMDQKIGEWEHSSTFHEDNDRVGVLNLMMNNHYKYRYRTKETPPPTHEEIMTKWWEDGDGWLKVFEYSGGEYGLLRRDLTQSHDAKYRSWYKKEWFIDKKSSDIPPEITNA